MPQRYSRHRRRYSRTERWRLRPGGIRDHSGSAGCRPAFDGNENAVERECGFSYRSSIFNTTERGRYIILEVSFALREGAKPSIAYADLQKFFGGRAGEPALAEVRAAVREIRHRKAMLIVPGDDDARSAGSFFKNPMVPQAFFEELAKRLKSRGLQLPSYPAADGFRKLPAAWLVEQAGFAKGYTKGAAGISRKHALAIINRGGATAAEIIVLKDDIQARVFGEFGIELMPEPVFVGFGSAI